MVMFCPRRHEGAEFRVDSGDRNTLSSDLIVLASLRFHLLLERPQDYVVQLFRNRAPCGGNPLNPDTAFIPAEYRARC